MIKSESSGISYIIIYIFEPSRIEYPDTSPRHLQFVYHSIAALDTVLSKFNRRVEVFYGEAVDVFSYLNEEFDINSIFSYQESGTQASWERDKKLKMVCKSNQIN